MSRKVEGRPYLSVCLPSLQTCLYYPGNLACNDKYDNKKDNRYYYVEYPVAAHVQGLNPGIYNYTCSVNPYGSDGSSHYGWYEIHWKPPCDYIGVSTGDAC